MPHDMLSSIAPPPSQLADAERLSPRNFARLAQLIQEYSGIKMPASKRAMLTLRLRGRLRALELETLDQYCDHLFLKDGLDAEIVHLIDAVSTNKTDFFREQAHFDYLHGHALPALASAGRRKLKLWSAAASMGAEAYTLAMVLEEFRLQNQGPDYAILATDICTEMLARAVAGRYPKAMIEPVPQALRTRYFLQSRDPEENEVRIVPHLRGKILCARLNLMAETYPVERDMDIIFCRNVLIYFDKPTQRHVLERLCGHLRPGGYLVLGHSESAAGADLPLTSATNTIFQKT